MKNYIFNAVCLSVLATTSALIDCSGSVDVPGGAAGSAATGVGGGVGVGGASGLGGGTGVGGASETGGGSGDTGGSVGAGGMAPAGAGGNATGAGGASMGNGGATTGAGGATTGSGGATPGTGGAPPTGTGGSTGTGGNPNPPFCPAAEPTAGSDCTAPANGGPAAATCRYTTARGGAVDCACRMNGGRNDAGMRVDTWACVPVVVRPDAGAPPPPPMMDAGLRDTCPAAAIANATNCAAFTTGLVCPGDGNRDCTCRAVGGGAVKLWNCAARAADGG